MTLGNSAPRVNGISKIRDGIVSIYYNNSMDIPILTSELGPPVSSREIRIKRGTIISEVVTDWPLLVCYEADFAQLTIKDC